MLAPLFNEPHYNFSAKFKSIGLRDTTYERRRWRLEERQLQLPAQGDHGLEQPVGKQHLAFGHEREHLAHGHDVIRCHVERSGRLLGDYGDERCDHVVLVHELHIWPGPTYSGHKGEAKDEAAKVVVNVWSEDDGWSDHGDFYSGVTTLELA